MLRKICTQSEFDFQPSHLKITNEYFARYEAISRILDANPEIVDLVHADLRKVVRKRRRCDPGAVSRVTSDSVLRMLICQLVEGESLRGTVIRIDDSGYLRRFTRIYNGAAIDFTWLCRLKNAIRDETWAKINDVVVRAAVKDGAIQGDKLRLDTTAYETNVHWPSDSSLLWDTYRVLARNIKRLREMVPEVVGSRHLQVKRARRLAQQIARDANKSGKKPKRLKSTYKRLLALVEAILQWSEEVAGALRDDRRPRVVRCRDGLVRVGVLGRRVVDQARRRVLDGEKVPNDDKLFSIFEEHTEFLIRGKARKNFELGHMVLFEQVEGKLITGYKVLPKRKPDATLVEPALARHEKLFGQLPKTLAADAAFCAGRAALTALRERIDNVSIPALGRRRDDDLERERSTPFKTGQQFRAGIEGTISFLKRTLGLWRCLNRGWSHYVATVGCAVFVHNLLQLAAGFT